jgi:hypothetical protein
LAFALDAGGGVYHSRFATIGGFLALLIDAAPATLDTLNELAAALGDDPNFAATLTAALATKAPDLLVPDVVAGAAYTVAVGDRYAAKRLTNAGLVTVTLGNAPPVGARIRFKGEGAGGFTFAAADGMTIHSRDSAMNSGGLYAVAEAWRDTAGTWTLLGDVKA